MVLQERNKPKEVAKALPQASFFLQSAPGEKLSLNFDQDKADDKKDAGTLLGFMHAQDSASYSLCGQLPRVDFSPVTHHPYCELPLWSNYFARLGKSRKKAKDSQWQLTQKRILVTFFCSLFAARILCWRRFLTSLMLLMKS